MKNLKKKTQHLSSKVTELENENDFYKEKENKVLEILMKNSR